MTVAIPSGLTDDNEFIDALNSIIAGVLRSLTPDAVWVVHVDNWFDHKWLRFSGNGAIASEIPVEGYYSVKQPFWQDKLTFPPFSPDRIVEQWSFSRSGDDYIEAPLTKLPHRNQRTPSPSNLYRRVEGFGSSVLFIWYSGNTLKNGRGSVMLYSTGRNPSVSWFAALRRNRKWTVDRTKAISREEVSRLVLGV
jgi:hypothetical protein